MNVRTLGAPHALRCGRHQVRCHGRSRQQQITVCRYDLRKSANNAEERRMERPKGTTPAEKGLTAVQLKAARASIVYQRAYQLCGGTKGQLSIQMCLFLFTEQPQLLELSTDLLVARISSLSKVLGIPLPDAAELLVRCGSLIDVLPLRLHSTAESLSVALQLPKPQTLVMLASDVNLLDTPPLRVKQQVDGLAAVLGIPVAAVATMVAGCPHVLKVEGAALQIRWANLQALLQLSSPQLLHLLQQEPRLLMPSSQHITQNHAAICQVFGITPQTLNRWVAAAPMILLIAAQQLEKRVGALGELLFTEARLLGIPEQQDRNTAAVAAAAADHLIDMDDNSDHQQDSDMLNNSSSEGWISVARSADSLTAYISKDPRVLLLSPLEVTPRLRVVQQELMCSWECIVWLVMNHPSYLVVEPGSVTGWMFDVRHLCQMSTGQVIQLALCPQVFLTMSPEQVLLSLQAFSQAHQFSYADTLDICSKCPLLLEQHPAVTAAALQQLLQLITNQELLRQLITAVPDMLLLASRLEPLFTAAAAAMALSSSLFGLMIKNQAGLWWVLVPRQQWQPQQGALQQRVPQWIDDKRTLVLQSLSALRECGLRPAAVMQEAAALQPALLTLGPAEIQRHVEILEDICSSCSYWQQQLRASLPPEQLGKAILRARVWRPRLLFMVENDLSRRIGLSELMRMNSTEFRECFGQDYQLWQIDKQQQRFREFQRWQQWQQQQASAWQHQPVLGWKRVGDHLQLEQQRQQLESHEQQQITHKPLQEPQLAAAAATARSAADSSASHKRLFAVKSVSGNSSQSAENWQQQQGQWSPDDGSSNEQPDAEVVYANVLDAAPDAQWQQFSSGDDGSDDSIESDLDNEEEDGHDDQNESLDIDNQQQHVEKQQWQQQRIARNGSKGVAWQEPPLSRKEMQLLNIQQSGVELYGTWEGCLLQPVDTVVQHYSDGSSS